MRLLDVATSDFKKKIEAINECNGGNAVTCAGLHW